MKTNILALALATVVAFAAFAAEPVNKSAIEITVKVASEPSAADRRAMRFVVTAENVARIGAGVEPLPVSTAVDLKDSYEVALTRIIKDAHRSYIEQAGSQDAVKASITEEQAKELNASLAEIIASGVPVSAIIESIKATKAEK